VLAGRVGRFSLREESSICVFSLIQADIHRNGAERDLRLGEGGEEKSDICIRGEKRRLQRVTHLKSLEEKY